MKRPYNATTIAKFKDIADIAQERFNFADFWYKFCTWEDKLGMDADVLHWRNSINPRVTIDDFAAQTKIEKVTERLPLKITDWFVTYFQKWLMLENITGDEWIARHGKTAIEKILNQYEYYHCHDVSVLVEDFQEEEYEVVK